MQVPVIIGVLTIGISLFCIAFFGFRIFFTHYSTYEELALRRINENLDQVYLFMDPLKFYHLSLFSGATFFLLGFAMGGTDLATGFLQGGVLGVLAYFVPGLLVRIRIRQRTEKLCQQLPETLDMLSSSMQAGLTLQQAIERGAKRLPNPIAQELGVITQECRLGTGIATAVNHFAERISVLELKIVSAATEISIRLGGNLSETYEKLGTMIRDRLMFEREMGAMTAEGRMQGIVMAMLPFVILVLMTFINRPLMLPFILSKVGICLLILVAVMQIAAYFWIKKITDVEY
jgi:tight adherence protein B